MAFTVQNRVGAVSTYTFSNITDDHTIDATFQTPLQAIRSIISDMEDINLLGGTENNLISKLESATTSLENNQENAAVNKLNAFINQIEALSSKKISSDDVQQLINAVEEIGTFLGG
ncbi:hypothetical protein ACFLVM_01645 [Chloroflexota bacterium]